MGEEFTQFFLGLQPPSAPSRPVELIRRATRGGYMIQFAAEAAAFFMEAGIKDIALASLGRWTWAPLRDVGRTSVVIVGVPTSVAEGEVKATLLRCNADSWGAQLPAPEHIRISRLARRSADPQQPRTPTRSIRLSAPAPFCAFLCRQGTAVFGFQLLPVREYVMSARRCFRCGQVGNHLAAFCRNAPRCQRCGGGHLTSSCRHMIPEEGRPLSPRSLSPIHLDD